MKGLGVVLLFLGIILIAILATKNVSDEKKRFDVELNLKKYHEFHGRAPGIRSQKFAVLVNGSYEAKHFQNMSTAYRLLIDSGFVPAHIFVLDDYRAGPTPYPVDSRPTERSLHIVVAHIKKIIRANDLLFVYVTGHGNLRKVPEERGNRNMESEQAFICFARDMINDRRFFALFRDLPASLVFLFDQCYGGSFSQIMPNLRQNIVSISASQPREESQENSFPQAFFGAFRNLNADQDMNNKIDITEAFNFAVLNDPNVLNRKQHPTYYTNTSSKIYLN